MSNSAEVSFCYSLCLSSFNYFQKVFLILMAFNLHNSVTHSIHCIFLVFFYTARTCRLFLFLTFKLPVIIRSKFVCGQHHCLNSKHGLLSVLSCNKSYNSSPWLFSVRSTGQWNWIIFSSSILLFMTSGDISDFILYSFYGSISLSVSIILLPFSLLNICKVCPSRLV